MKQCLSCKDCFNAYDWQCPSCKQSPDFNQEFPLFAPKLSEENEGYPDEVFAELYQLEEKHFWFKSRNRLIIWAIEKYFPEAKNFLEIGCGTGFVLRGIRNALPHLDIYGSEIYSKGLMLTKERLPELNLMQMDACQIPYTDEFDLIGAFDVLEHIEDHVRVLSQLRKAVRDTGGGLILTVPQHKFLWSKLDEFSCHFRRYEREEITTLIESAGFKVEKVTSFVSLLLPVLMASRYLSYRSEKELDHLNELRISGPLNYLLETTMNMEQIPIKMGVSYPMGGSLLVVAKAV